MTDADTNRKIAEAMGWTNLHTRVMSSGVVLFGNPQHYNGQGLPAPTYAVDANAALPAVAEIMRQAGMEWKLYPLCAGGWATQLISNDFWHHMNVAFWSGTDPATPLCDMAMAALAVLAARAKGKQENHND